MVEPARAGWMGSCEGRKTLTARTFIVRIWRQELGEGQMEWRGRVQDVLTAQVRFFRGWEHLATTILEMLANSSCDAREAAEGDLPASSENEKPSAAEIREVEK